MAEGRPRKIAVVGTTGFDHDSPQGRVECFSWERLAKIANLADFDVVILDLLSLEDPSTLDVDNFRETLNVRTTREILRKSEGAIFVLGDPRFGIRWESDQARYEEPFLAWTGLVFSWDDRPGDTVERGWEANSGPFKLYADKLVRWNYSLARCHPYVGEGEQMWNVDELQKGGLELQASVNQICWNSYGNALVFSVTHAVEYFPDRNSQLLGSKRTEPLTRPIFFLPKSRLSEEETLEFVLRELCGVDVSSPEPEWLEDLQVPGQDKVDRELREIEDQVNRLVEEHGRKLEERARLRTPLELLYQSGNALEEAVWSVLEELGAEVEKPVERNKEDGWLTVKVGDETFEGVLEIKSTDKQHFGTGGLRQLFDWINRGIARRRKRYTGIFVGNSSTKEPPRFRPWPFNPNWTEDAELYEFAAIRTEDLYVLYLLDRTGRLDRDEFWRRLFSTKGPFDMQPYRKKLAAEEQDQLSNLPLA